ncbi:MAG: haloacid dehalogenase type II, partial [Pseudomonadota bacterium]
MKALIFDVFGTVVDWREGVAAEAERVFAPKGIDVDPRAFADAWRGEYQPAMERIRSGGRGYVPLD